jgi:hypothetical protein
VRDGLSERQPSERWAEWEKDREMGRVRDGLSERWAEWEMCREMGRVGDGPRDGPSGRWTERWAEWEMDRVRDRS